MTRKQSKRITKNLLKFTLPILSIFFFQLSLGVDWRASSLVALYALYGFVSDYLKKYSEEL